MRIDLNANVGQTPDTRTNREGRFARGVIECSKFSGGGR